jgi:pimeloyl-ACP methyl ester carboxylesterase
MLDGRFTLPLDEDPWHRTRAMATARLQFPHCHATLDPSIRRELVEHAATDGFPLTGILHRPAGRDPDTAVLAMHPRVDFSHHYLVPGLLAGGYAFMGATTRYLNHDADALHERLLLDVAGSVAFLRDRGFRRVVLVGNSGGGSLFAFYLEQAGKPAADRLDRAPSGDAVPLRETELPMADALVLLAAHPGEGEFLLDRLDPSVVDEADPLATDPALDMYDTRNGYRPMAEGPSRYGAEFLAAFRAGQRARCARLDAAARAAIEATRQARATMKDAAPADRAALARQAYQRPYLLIYRTLADPRYLDPTLDPSQRPAGSIFSFGRDPIVGNFGEGLARTMSARGWLSTWSGLSSNASLARTMPHIRVPTLVIGASADMDIYPSETRAAFTASGAADKEHVDLPWAGHYLQPVGAEGARLPHPQVRVCEEVLLPWLRARFPA